MLQAWGEGYSLPPEVQTLQAGLGPSHGCPLLTGTAHI